MSQYKRGERVQIMLWVPPRLRERFALYARLRRSTMTALLRAYMERSARTIKPKDLEEATHDDETHA